MPAGTREIRERDRRTQTDAARPGGGVAGALGVAAGYGLAMSALILFTIERIFGTRGTAGRLMVLAATVGALVAGAAVIQARRSSQRRHVRGG